MFCPNCGQETNLEQTYCRSCGAEIREPSYKVSKHDADLEVKTDWLKRAGLFSIGIINSFALIIIAMIILRAFDMGGDRGLPFLLLLLMSLTAILAGTVSVLYFEKTQSGKLKKRLTKGKKLVPALFEQKSTRKKLNESSFQQINSVTDHTTELFTSKISRIKTSGELG